MVNLESLVQEARKALIHRDFEKALPLLNRAGAIAIEGEAGNEVIVPILRAIGDARCGLEDWEGAEAHYREALARVEQMDGSPIDTAGLLCNLAYLLDKQERFDESDEVHQRALVLRTRQLGRDHLDLVPIMNNMAYRFMSLGDLERARGLLERALTLVEAHASPNDLALVEPLNNLGALYRRQGKPKEAMSLLTRALRILETKVPSPDHPDLIVFLRNTAAALHDGDRHDEADVLEARAERIEKRARG